MSVLVVVDHDRGLVSPTVSGVLNCARILAEKLDTQVDAITVGQIADSLAPELGKYGAATVFQIHNEELNEFGARAWAGAVTEIIDMSSPQVVMCSGTDRGNEIIAHVGAILDLPAAMNCVEILDTFDGTNDLQVIRSRWGGSLLEECTLQGPTKLVTIANYVFEPQTSESMKTETQVCEVSINEEDRCCFIFDRVDRVAGVTLATSPVVVSGGRGVGSAEGFAPLEDLAALLHGVVGCSRAVTNNGWRNHADQVGQTGIRIAPELYIACGISGAIQHWVGAMASKNILAINTDAQANIVSKAGYAVIGDLHKVVPAICAEIRRRQEH